MVQFIQRIFWLTILVTVSMGFTNVPVTDTEHDRYLFSIERSLDPNEVIYEINLDRNGKLHEANPIKIYWLKKTNNNKTEPLTFIQQQYAYGLIFLDSINMHKKEWSFQFVSYPKRTFILKKMANETFKVYTVVENQEVLVKRIFVNFDNKKFWFPTISAVELHGQNVSSGQMIAEIVKP